MKNHKILTAVLIVVLLSMMGSASPETPTDNAEANQQHVEEAQPEPAPVSVVDEIKNDPQYKKPKVVAYDELFRNSDKYKGQYVKYTGQVVQVLGGPGGWELRVDVTKTGDEYYTYYEDTVFVASHAEDRVIEKDIIEFVGRYDGPLTYESVLGGDITIPSLSIVEHKLVGRGE